MKLKRNKLLSLFLIFFLLALSGNLYAKMRGAKLIVTKKDGQQVQGELITVKPNSLLLLNTEGRDVSVGIADIKVIRVMKKSKALLGAGMGAIIVGGGAALYVGAVEDVEDAWKFILLFGVGGAIVGLLVGGEIGASLGTDKTIRFEGMTDSEIEEVLEKLRKKARIRDYK